MKILSIIIPVYNGSQYIEKCIRSIASQNINENLYELIVINDGSTDDCLSKVKGLQKIIKNLILFDQNNGGVCTARNYGIDHSIGDWVTFVDQDDYLIPNSLNSIICSIDSAINNDIIMFPSRFQNTDGDLSNHKLITENQKLFGPIEGIAFYYKYRNLGNAITGLDAPWGICYKREFLNKNNLRFLESVIYMDDAEFLGRVFCLAKNCSFYNIPFYVHIDNKSSVSNSRIVNSLKAINGFIEAAKNLKEFQNNPQLSNRQKEFINQSVLKLTLKNVQSCVSRSGINLGKFKYVRYSLKEKKLLKLELKGCDPFHTSLGKIYNFSIWLFLFFTLKNMIDLSVRIKFKNLIVKMNKNPKICII